MVDKPSNGRYVELKREFESRLHRNLTQAEIHFIEWLVIQEARQVKEWSPLRVKSLSYPEC